MPATEVARGLAPEEFNRRRDALLEAANVLDRARARTIGGLLDDPALQPFSDRVAEYESARTAAIQAARDVAASGVLADLERGSPARVAAALNAIELWRWMLGQHADGAEVIDAEVYRAACYLARGGWQPLLPRNKRMASTATLPADEDVARQNLSLHAGLITVACPRLDSSDGAFPRVAPPAARVPSDRVCDIYDDEANADPVARSEQLVRNRYRMSPVPQRALFAGRHVDAVIAAWTLAEAAGQHAEGEDLEPLTRAADSLAERDEARAHAAQLRAAARALRAGTGIEARRALAIAALDLHEVAWADRVRQALAEEPQDAPGGAGYLDGWRVQGNRLERPDGSSVDLTDAHAKVARVIDEARRETPPRLLSGPALEAEADIGSIKSILGGNRDTPGLKQCFLSIGLELQGGPKATPGIA